MEPETQNEKIARLARDLLRVKSAIDAAQAAMDQVESELAGAERQYRDIECQLRACGGRAKAAIVGDHIVLLDGPVVAIVPAVN